MSFVSKENLNVAKNPIIELGYFESKKCAFICDLTFFSSSKPYRRISGSCWQVGILENRRLGCDVSSAFDGRGKFCFFRLALRIFCSNSNLVKFVSKEFLLGFDEPETFIKLSNEHEKFLCLHFWNLQGSILSLSASSVLARKWLTILWYLSSSDVHDQHNADSDNVQALSVILFFFWVTSTVLFVNFFE